MDEQRGTDPTPVEPPQAPPPASDAAAPAAAPAPRRRSWKGPLGTGAALVLAFAWGALTYRELGTSPRMFDSAAVAVAGSESPPAWVAGFVQAFCDGDAAHLAERIGPPLDGQTEQIKQAIESREWTCADVRYLGSGTNTTGDFYAYVTVEDDGGEQWWIFTVAQEKVVAIE
jgi:hypothetical protein